VFEADTGLKLGTANQGRLFLNPFSTVRMTLAIKDFGASLPQSEQRRIADLFLRHKALMLTIIVTSLSKVPAHPAEHAMPIQPATAMPLPGLVLRHKALINHHHNESLEGAPTHPTCPFSSPSSLCTLYTYLPARSFVDALPFARRTALFSLRRLCPARPHCSCVTRYRLLTSPLTPPLPSHARFRPAKAR
jgi:hypothetical protein